MDRTGFVTVLPLSIFIMVFAVASTGQGTNRSLYELAQPRISSATLVSSLCRLLVYPPPTGGKRATRSPFDRG
jgi:hypothetical protein